MKLPLIEKLIFCNYFIWYITYCMFSVLRFCHKRPLNEWRQRYGKKASIRIDCSSRFFIWKFISSALVLAIFSWWMIICFSQLKFNILCYMTLLVTFNCWKIICFFSVEIWYTTLLTTFNRWKIICFFSVKMWYTLYDITNYIPLLKDHLFYSHSKISHIYAHIHY